MIVVGPRQPVTSIAVLPFENLSGDPGNAYVARGFKEELVSTLQNVPELAIKNAQVMLAGKSNSQMGRELGVNEEAAAAVFGFVYHKQKKWIEAERAFKIATSASVFEANAFNWYSLMLGSVGRIDDALQQALAALEIDGSSAVINGRVAIMYTWTRENEKAGFYFERVRELGGSTASIFYANALYLLRLGDVDGALRVARYLVEPGQAFETELLFLPEFMPLRERPEFLELMQTLGVTDYWDKAGCS